MVTIAILYRGGGFSGITDEGSSFKYGVNQNSRHVSFCTL